MGGLRKWSPIFCSSQFPQVIALKKAGSQKTPACTMLAEKTGREFSNNTECDKDWKRGGVLWEHMVEELTWPEKDDGEGKSLYI